MTLSYLRLTSMLTALKKNCFTRRVSRQPWIFMDILGFCVCNLVSLFTKNSYFAFKFINCYTAEEEGWGDDSGSMKT